MDRLQRVAAKTERLVVGLNSGTSMDATDVAVVRCAGKGARTRLAVIASGAVPHPESLRSRLLRAPDLSCAEVCRLHRETALAFADAALRVLADAGIPLSDVDLVGSHGQTVCHLPDPEGGGAATLQIGDADLLAARLGVPVVADFRAADTAAGGGGAPLMPYLDLVLFRDAPGTVTLNLGGITALTFATGDPTTTLAFDVGPCNVTLDLLAAHLGGAHVRCDVDGRLAARGRVRDDLLRRLLAHPFFKKAPPKTSGREEFGGHYVERLVARAAAEEIPPLDLLATHTALVGRSVAEAVEAFLPGGRGAVTQVVASGGGVKNPVLWEGLRRALAPIPLRVLGAADGVGSDAKEAVLFALLAHARLDGEPANVPGATGAFRAVSLGKIAGG
jgi:anhydro-N-acetylmuramic acid kinase